MESNGQSESVSGLASNMEEKYDRHGSYLRQMEQEKVQCSPMFADQQNWDKESSKKQMRQMTSTEFS